MMLRHAFLFLAGAVLAAAQAPNPPADLKSNPAPTATAVNPALPTLYIAGDSTAAKGKGEHQQGWAEPFADYFDPAKINVVNRARGGRSSRTYITEGLWDAIVGALKPGDTVLIQFGHNDGGALNDEPPPPLRARGSLKGLGEETREIDNVLTKKHEVVHTFGWYMRKMIDDVKAKHATAIVLSPTVRDLWHDGHVERGPGHYTQWSYDVAKAEAVPFIDVTNVVADEFETMGPSAVKALYEQDFVHFNAEGADLHARAVVAGLKGLRPSPVEKVLSAKGAAVPADRFAWLRLARPADPKLPSLFLVGDSTVRNGRGDGAGGQWGWGDFLAPYFDTSRINVVNRAVGGTGIETFRTFGHWANTLRLIKPGDFVMIQFGHNDNPPRGPLPGIGEETEERVNPRTKQKETVHTWGWYLRQYLDEIQAKGATPIVCSLVPRKIWREGRVVRNKDTFAGWAAEVAADRHVAFIDLNERIAERYDSLGPEKVDALFADPHTHTSEAGAKIGAACVIEGLHALAVDPLAPYLRQKNDSSLPQ